MSSLGALISNNAWIKELLASNTGHTEVVRAINESFGEVVTSEKSVRRYRKKLATSDLDPLIAPNGNTVALPVRPRREAAVPQWVPGIDIDPNEGGEFRTHPIDITDLKVEEASPEEAELLGEFGLDAEVWEVVAARMSQWESGDRTLQARRVSFRKRGQGSFLVSEDALDHAFTVSTTGRETTLPWLNPNIKTLVCPAGDLQFGKQDGGGTAATVERFVRITDEIATWIESQGGVENLVLPWLGDCIEGYVSQGGRNLVYLDLTPSEQVRVYRRLMMHQLAVLAPLAGAVLVPVVPGNHDETTRQQIMPKTDSWAIEGAAAVRDWMSGRDEYEHVQFAFPDNGEPDLTVDVAGVTTTFMHGHGTGKGRPDGILGWWAQQSHGRQLAGQSDLLVSAHWHHLRVQATGGNRTWLQIPALDGGSGWFRQRTGDEPDSGIITFELDQALSSSWSNLKLWT